MTAHSVEYIRYRIPEQQSAEFLAAYTRAAAQLAAAPQCADYELARCEEDFEHFIRFLRGYSAVHGGEETDSCGAGQGAGFRRQGERPCSGPKITSD